MHDGDAVGNPNWSIYLTSGHCQWITHSSWRSICSSSLPSLGHRAGGKRAGVLNIPPLVSVFLLMEIHLMVYCVCRGEWSSTAVVSTGEEKGERGCWKRQRIGGRERGSQLHIESYL